MKRKESEEVSLTRGHFLTEPRLKAQNIHSKILRVRKIRLSLGGSEADSTNKIRSRFSSATSQPLHAEYLEKLKLGGSPTQLCLFKTFNFVVERWMFCIGQQRLN